jgi:hypothetical protein
VRYDPWALAGWPHLMPVPCINWARAAMRNQLAIGNLKEKPPDDPKSLPVQANTNTTLGQTMR